MSLNAAVGGKNRIIPAFPEHNPLPGINLTHTGINEQAGIDFLLRPRKTPQIPVHAYTIHYLEIGCNGDFR